MATRKLTEAEITKIVAIVQEIGMNRSDINTLLTALSAVEIEAQQAVDPKTAELDALFKFESDYLKLIREYKEEIKFLNSLQEDLRKERANFFAFTLREVSKTLSEAQIDDKVADKWLQELVNSYSASLDLSGEYAKENSMQVVAELRKKQNAVANPKKENAK